MEQQYTRITTSLFEAIQKVTSSSSEQKQELLVEGLAMPKGNDPHSQGVRVAMGSREMVKKYTPGSEEHKQFMAGHAVGKAQVKKKMDSLEPKIKTMGEESEETESIDEWKKPWSPEPATRPPNPKDAEHKKASMLIDKIRSLRQLGVEAKEKGDHDKHKEYHERAKQADQEYQKLGHKSLMNSPLRSESVDEAMTPEFEKKFAETPKGVEVHMKHKETGKIVKNKFIGTHSAVAAAKKHIASMEKQGYVVHAKKLIEQEVEQTDEAMSHQAATTMKHIKPGTLKQNYGDRQDAANIKPGIKGVADRLAMLDRAKKEGRLKEEEHFDETIIKEDLNIDAPEQFTFKDYLTAVTSLVGSELEEHQIVAVAYEAFRTQEEDIILEELTRDDLKQKMKAHMDAGHQISGEKFSMKDGKPYGEYVVTDKETGVRRKYIHHGSTRRVENMGSRTKKDAKAND
jgi:hypothetical protein